jgi:hypothetical protein
MASPKELEELKEPLFLLYLCSKKKILPSIASLMNLFSKNAFGRASPKNEKAKAEAPKEFVPNRLLASPTPSTS